MRKLKKKILILCIICLGLLCFGCSNANESEKEDNVAAQDETEVNDNENNKSKENIDYNEYLSNIVNENAEDLNWTMLLMDLKSGEVLGSYGDVNSNFEPGDVLKPMLYASLIENGISLEDSVDVSIAEYNGQYARSKENFAEGETKTILESMELLNNPAIINLWKEFDKKDMVLYDLSSIGVMLDDNMSQLLGRNTIVSVKDIAKVYNALANSEEQTDVPFTMSAQTKQTMNDVLQKTFDNACEFTTEGHIPYGVFDTVIYKTEENGTTNINFAGYLKDKEQNGEGILLVVNVKSAEEAYTAENLKEVVNDIFVDYTLE